MIEIHLDGKPVTKLQAALKAELDWERGHARMIRERLDGTSEVRGIGNAATGQYRDELTAALDRRLARIGVLEPGCVP